MMNCGWFIILEGADGVGKSSQIQMLSDWLGELREVYCTRMPGGHPVYGSYIREILLSAKDQVKGLTELYGHLFDKALHIEQVIIPKLAVGTTVLCDRAFASTMVYQGILKDKVHSTQQLNYLFWSKDGPLYQYLPKIHEIILDVSDETAIARQEKRAASIFTVDDKYEKAGADFKQKIRDAYRNIDTLTTKPPYYRAHISAEGSKEEVQERIRDYIREAHIV